MRLNSVKASDRRTYGRARRGVCFNRRDFLARLALYLIGLGRVRRWFEIGLPGGAIAALGCSEEQLPTLSMTFPNQSWLRLTPAEAGFDTDSWTTWLRDSHPRGSGRFGEVHGDDEWGAVLVRGGYLVKVWGNPDYLYQSASVGKAFTKLALQLALDRGLIASQDDPVMSYWTGSGLLSHPHKYLDRDHHRTISFRHLWQHTAGFPLTNGYNWRERKTIPDWAVYTGDPDYDNYAHRPPGEGRSYSSGGYWRLTQALTAVWRQNLKSVLDEQLFGPIGIRSEGWRWLGGREVRDHAGLYPEMPGYGEFADPPYEIAGNACLGGGGWAIMSPMDLARVGVLISAGGIWAGRRLISDTELVDGHRGGNDSDLGVTRWPDSLVLAKVTTSGLDFPRDLRVSPMDRLVEATS